MHSDAFGCVQMRSGAFGRVRKILEFFVLFLIIFRHFRMVAILFVQKSLKLELSFRLFGHVKFSALFECLPPKRLISVTVMAVLAMETAVLVAEMAV